MSEKNRILPTIDQAVLLPLKTRVGDGTLVAIENGREIPFVSQRVFTVAGVTPGAWRGNHAHKNCAQAIVCVTGMLEVECDDGQQKKSLVLSGPENILYIPAGIWARERYDSHSTVVMVLCSDFYDEGDYLRNYEDFLNFRGVNG